MIKNIIIIILNLSTGFFIKAQEIDSKKFQLFSIESELLKQSKTFNFISLPNNVIKEDIILVSNEKYYSSNDYNLEWDVYFSKTKKQKPAIILIHGGGWFSGNKNMNQQLCVALANLGYQCFSINYRLSHQAKYPAAILDVEIAFKKLLKQAKKYNINKNQIVILGCSSGGLLATLFGTKNSKIKAVINIDGILAFDHKESKEGEMAAYWLNASLNENRLIWQEASPLYQVNEKFPPILFVNSGIERFHAGRNDFIFKLNEMGIYNELQTFENCPHTFWLFNPWFEPTIVSINNFLSYIFKLN